MARSAVSPVEAASRRIDQRSSSHGGAGEPAGRRLGRQAALGELAEDVVGAHDGVLKVRPRVALEAHGLVEIERDHLVAPELQQEVPQRADRDRARVPVGGLGSRRAFALTAPRDLLPRPLEQDLVEVVGFDAQTLPPRHLDEGLLLVLGREPVFLAEAFRERPRRLRRERDDLVGEVLGAVRLGGEPEHAQSFAHDLLRVGLADVDDVVHARRAAEGRRRRIPALVGGPPDRVRAHGRRDLVGSDGARAPVGSEALVVEVRPEEAELPELIRDVLRRVGHGAVRAHEDLVGLLHAGELFGAGEAQHPAAGLLSLRLQDHRAGVAQALEGARPEFLAEDVALAREQVVGDAQPAHRREMGRGDRFGHRGGDARRLVVARLDRVQRLGAPGLRLGLRGVRLADLGVQVPAEVGETLRARRARGQARLADRAPRRVERSDALEVDQAGHDVRHLDARVVEIVLHLDVVAEEPQRPHEDVAQHGVPQMSDVRRLVRIDVRVLDHDFSGLPGDGGRRAGRAEQRGGERPALETRVEVAAALDLDLGNARRPPHGAGELFGDRARRALQGLGEVERDGTGEVAERHARRALEHDAVESDPVEIAHGVAHRVGERRPEGVERRRVHGRRSIAVRRKSPECRARRRVRR